MGLISDARKAIAKEQDNPHIIIFGPGERLDCKICGKEYISRGKYDPGYCRECERGGRVH